MSRCAAIILAAGRGTRLGFDKILTPIADKPVLQYSLEAVQRTEEVIEVIIPTREDIREQIEACLEKVDLKVPYQVILGGKERQDSVLAGLEAVDSDAGYALIHDSARPMIRPSLIRAVLEVAIEHGGAVCGKPCSDTLKRANENSLIECTLDRKDVWQVETPQIFELASIREAYRRVIQDQLSITDDTSAWELMGKKARLVDSKQQNFKITRADDWALAELFLREENLRELRKDLHALNNYLSPLVGYLPLLGKYLDSPERARDYLNKIEVAMPQVTQTLQKIMNETSFLSHHRSDRE